MTRDWTSYAMAPGLCLAVFNELNSIVLEAFTKKHDPHWDIALNEIPLNPVIDLPEFGPAHSDGLVLKNTPPARRKRGRQPS